MNSELACTLAAIILADAKQEITADAINKVVKAANVEVKAQWPILFAQFLSGKNIMELMTSIGSAAPAQAAAGAAAGAAAAEPVKEKTEEQQIVAGFAFGADSSSEEESS